MKKKKTKIIIYGIGDYDKNGKEVDVNITSINVDNFNRTISVTREIGCDVKTFELTIEFAQKIGFINIDTISKFC